ncbi:MAG: SDR family oxidoreductase [Alphaproteobacteria bacterium]|jgi:NAD(P)-dependent dehydrogenase (short-subunit alcohol dehydrogenase family)|nr:SDR family oxidoreductase [Alphaproteobacteria bacterium]
MEKPVTLIIGLGQTVGEAIARRLLDDHHNVVAVGPDQRLLDDMQKTTGDKVTLHHGATNTLLGLRNALAMTLETHGHIDNVICIPSLPEEDRLADLDMEQFNRLLLDTVGAAAQSLRVFSTEMAAQREDPSNAVDRARQAGSFTFVLSLGAVMSQPGWFSESVTQHAVLGVVKAGALELAEDDIRVNAIVALRPRAEGREPWLRERTPFGRPALAEEIAETALFLTNPASAIITGEAIVLDGGRRQLSGLFSRGE